MSATTLADDPPGPPTSGQPTSGPPAAPPAADPDTEARPGLGRRIAIMASVVLGSTLYATTLLIASTLLPQMRGTMAATPDEVAWVMTFNILATAVMTPMTGWLAANFGRRRVMVGSMTLFSSFTFLCGQADSLEMLVLWRILQGASGAPVIPLAQTILLDSFPRRQHGVINSIYGMAVVIGPVIGPTLGGALSEAYSWRWAFYVLVPVGLLSTVGLRLSMLPDGARARVNLDWIGFLTISAAISCIQLVLSRGQRLDWYDSPEIVIETIGAALAFYLFVSHSLTASHPFLNLRLLLDRNYALGLLLVLVYGMLNFTPVVLLPPLLQEHAGFPDTMIGEIVGARGIGATMGFFSALFLARLDPRVGMTIGFGIQVVAGLWLMTFDLNTPMELLALNSVLQGISVGTVWVPLTIATFNTLEGRQLPEAMAVFHLMRNIGSSFFIALCVTEIVRTQSQNYERLNEAISPFNERLRLPWVMGNWSLETLPDLARLAKEVNRQAAMIGYLNAFTMYTATSALAMVLVLLVPKIRRKT